MERDRMMDVPAKQRMERKESLVREHSLEHEAALRKAVALDVPHAFSTSPYGTFTLIETEEAENSGKSSGGSPSAPLKHRSESLDDFVERLFHVDEAGNIMVKKS